MVGYLIWIGCRYEAYALETGRVPTITRLVWSARRKPLHVFAASLVGVVGGLGWVAYHLLVEGWEE